MCQKCVACGSALESKELMKCLLCDSFYHYLCIDMTKENYGKLSATYKAAWKCPSCKAKSKKGPENTESTPVKGIEAIVSQDNNLINYLEDFQNFKIDILRSLTKSQDEQKIAILNLMDEKFESIRESIDFLSSKYNRMKKDLDEAQKSVQDLKKENDVLRTDVKNLNSRVFFLEKESRASNLELHCVPEHKNENLLNMVEQMVRMIGSPIKEGQILKCARISKIDRDSPQPRSVLITFISPLIRDHFYASVIDFNRNKYIQERLNTSHLGLCGEIREVYIAEHLSPQAKSLQAATRKFAKNNRWQFVWTRNGNVFVRKSTSSDVIHIKSEETLRKLI